MEKKLALNAYAKVNLQLDVLGRREDGYHELAGVMQRVSLCDTVEITPVRGGGITVESSLPLPPDNTLFRAAEGFLAGSSYGASIAVTKNVPSEAGLGGASADAAAVLRGLNGLFAGTELERTEDGLFRLGLSVGADVPFCLAGGCAVARGVGERLEPLPMLPLVLLIVKGERGVSTGKLFRYIDGLGGAPCSSRLPQNSLENAVDAVRRGDIPALGGCMLNALEPAAVSFAPEIAEYVARMRALGALGACMTGSGAAVIGLFESEAAALAAKERFADCEFAEVCRAIE